MGTIGQMAPLCVELQAAYPYPYAYAYPERVPPPQPHPHQDASQDAVLSGYRACLRESLRRLVEVEGCPTSDPRVGALTAHLTRRQADAELHDEVLRLSASPGSPESPAGLHGDSFSDTRWLRRQLLHSYFRGVDLRYR